MNDEDSDCPAVKLLLAYEDDGRRRAGLTLEFTLRIELDICCVCVRARVCVCVCARARVLPTYVRACTRASERASERAREGERERTHTEELRLRGSRTGDVE